MKKAGLDTCTRNQIISLLDDVAMLVHLLFAQTNEQHIVKSVFINSMVQQ